MVSREVTVSSPTASSSRGATVNSPTVSSRATAAPSTEAILNRDTAADMEDPGTEGISRLPLKSTVLVLAVVLPWGWVEVCWVVC